MAHPGRYLQALLENVAVPRRVMGLSAKSRKRLPTTTAEYRALESEASFQSWVIAEARRTGWLVAHVTDSRRQDTTGLPDLVLARGGLVILAELKTETGEPRKEQRLWLAASGNHLWRPSMREKIMAQLA